MVPLYVFTITSYPKQEHAQVINLQQGILKMHNCNAFAII